MPTVIPLAPVANSQLREPKPEWLKVRAPGSPSYLRLKGLMRSLNLHTVCEEARCPNIGECWNHGTATFMILGGVCTRACAYCAVSHGRPAPADPAEPERVASAIHALGLAYVVITSVDRDDLEDGGAAFFAETILQTEMPGPGAYNGSIIVEKDVSVLKDEGRFVDGLRADPVRRIPKEAREPVPIGIAVKETEGDKPRLVVFGDTEFITNVELYGSRTGPYNYSLTVSALEWMAEREYIGPQPKDHRYFTLDMNAEVGRMVLLPGWLSTLTLLVMGVAIWVVRRR